MMTPSPLSLRQRGVIVRPFRLLDRVDKAREVFRLARQRMEAPQIAAILGTTVKVVQRIADEEGIVLPAAIQKIWPDKDDPGDPSTNDKDPFSWSAGRQADHHWKRAARKAREQRIALGVPAAPPPPPPSSPPPPAPKTLAVPATRRPPTQITPLYTIADMIIDEVASKHGLTVAEIKATRRSLKIVDARYEAFFRLSKETSMSLPMIGRKFGGYDHTTVLHGIRKHHERAVQGISRKWYNPRVNPKPKQPREPVWGVGGWH